jgi:hypothetical protein
MKEGEKELPAPIKGKADWREYKCLRLDNGVTVCLVHDRESKTTAAAATVNAGAAADPKSLPGLAHFCEHMVRLILCVSVFLLAIYCYCLSLSHSMNNSTLYYYDRSF